MPTLTSPPQAVSDIVPSDGEPDFLSELRAGVSSACEWLSNVARVETRNLIAAEDSQGMEYDDWRGAIRGEYSAARRQWSFFCPYWHSAQAAKALVWASRATNKPELVNDADKIGEFLLRNRVTGKGDVDRGLPLAFEDSPRTINTSAILESVDGLFHLADATQNTRYGEAALDALNWVEKNAYQQGTGLFENSYDPKSRKFVVIKRYGTFLEDWRMRPLLDDAVFLKGFHRFGVETHRRTFFETAECLLATEEPAGNWIRFMPCRPEEGILHPRHAFWWGGPMIDASVETGDSRFLAASLRSVDWYASALRRDGGFFRNTYDDFSTDSFGHATSGSACAAILFLRAAEVLHEKRYLPLAKRALEFCLSMQLRDTADPNLKGVILEKVLPPDGTDRSPFHVRDLGSIFFIQAASLYLRICQEAGDGVAELSGLRPTEC